MQTPDELFGELFIDVQLKKIFPDNKTFVDCTPKRKAEAILKDYLKIRSENNLSNTEIKKFVEDNFIIPAPPTSGYHTDRKDNIIEHIEELWTVLQREADNPVEGSSLVALPHPYIVPGGRFEEIYYWDSYFTMLGLAKSNRWDIIENMIENFAFLIRENGFIPNGNRTYFLSRSQPPYFSCMIELLASHKGTHIYSKYINELQSEYDFWMDKTKPTKHVVQMPDGSLLNRYYDQKNTPRPEAYRHEFETAAEYDGDDALLFKNLRAACESGWDFSGRWFKDGKMFAQIDTTNIVPVDLNCLLFHLESSLALAYRHTENKMEVENYTKKSMLREDAINKYFYNENDGWFYDYNIGTNTLSTQQTIAGITPFFFDIPSSEKIIKAADVIRGKFLQAGGVVTTLIDTGQQWDWPNGWAPLQWITIKALNEYGEINLAKEIAKRWAQLNIKVYKNTGKLMEKYNVVDTHLDAGGGEYPSQDGFGWTNGVLLKLLKTYEDII
jgi:alpha,alpha-trehalase